VGKALDELSVGKMPVVELIGKMPVVKLVIILLDSD
jgi:hypothetical protein